jgi:hypothetical protein
MTRKPMDPFARKMWQASLVYGGVLLGMFAVLTVIYLHARPRCSDRVVGQADSPGARWAAAVMERRCGEESPFFTHVNLRPAGSDLKRGFFSGSAMEGEIFVVEQDAVSSGVTLQWTAPDTLLIQCPGCAASLLQKKDEHWNGVLIKYDAPARFF